MVCVVDKLNNIRRSHVYEDALFVFSKEKKAARWMRILMYGRVYPKDLLGHLDYISIIPQFHLFMH